MTYRGLRLNLRHQTRKTGGTPGHRVVGSSPLLSESQASISSMCPSSVWTLRAAERSYLRPASQVREVNAAHSATTIISAPHAADTHGHRLSAYSPAGEIVPVRRLVSVTTAAAGLLVTAITLKTIPTPAAAATPYQARGDTPSKRGRRRHQRKRAHRRSGF